MALIKISLDALPLEKALGYDIVSKTGAIMITKGTVFTRSLHSKLEEVDLFVQGADLVFDDGESGEAPGIVTNKLAKLDIGKEVESFFLIVRDNAAHKLVECSFVGVIKDLSIVVEMPREGNGASARVIQFDPGQKIQAKLHAGRNEYVFQSFVMCVANNPTPIMFIKFPAGVKTVVLRKADRKHTNIAVNLILDANAGRSMLVRLKDLSDSGAAFVSDIMLDETHRYFMALKIKINGIEHSITLPCDIKNKKAVGKNWRYGVSFISNLEAKDRVFLQSFIYTL